MNFLLRTAPTIGFSLFGMARSWIHGSCRSGINPVDDAFVLTPLYAESTSFSRNTFASISWRGSGYFSNSWQTGCICSTGPDRHEPRGIIKEAARE